jgi:hypothetical protein
MNCKKCKFWNFYVNPDDLDQSKDCLPSSVKKENCVCYLGGDPNGRCPILKSKFYKFKIFVLKKIGYYNYKRKHLKTVSVKISKEDVEKELTKDIGENFAKEFNKEVIKGLYKKVKKEEKMKNYYFFYHHNRGNNKRGFTLTGYTDGKKIHFGLTLKHDIIEKAYKKIDGRNQSMARAISNPYKTLSVYKQSAKNVFYKEVNRVREQFDNMQFDIQQIDKNLKNMINEFKKIKSSKSFIFYNFVKKYKASDKFNEKIN